MTWISSSTNEVGLFEGELVCWVDGGGRIFGGDCSCSSRRVEIVFVGAKFSKNEDRRSEVLGKDLEFPVMCVVLVPGG